MSDGGRFTVVRHSGSDAFLQRAGQWLREAEAEHNLILSIAAEGAEKPDDPDALFATVEEGDRIAGGVFRTPPHKLGVTRMLLEAVPAVVEYVAAGAQFSSTPEDHRRWVEAKSVFFWEDGGVPVSMAMTRGRTASGARVSFVYTPPEWRRRGYASALVAAVSQRLLDSGCSFCVLYTDLSNPTSNALYRRLGYEPVCDVVDVEFDS